MPRDTSQVYTLPEAPFAANTLAQSARVNNNFSDIATALTNSLTRAESTVFDRFPSGTRMLFQQTAAPTGWTKDTGNNDKALRVVSGNVTGGGSNLFSAAFASRPLSGTVQSHTLDINQIPSHGHGVNDPSHKHNITNEYMAPFAGIGFATAPGGAGNQFYYVPGGTQSAFTGIGILANGGSQGHAHGLLLNNLDMNVAYVDVIIAQKN